MKENSGGLIIPEEPYDLEEVQNELQDYLRIVENAGEIKGKFRFEEEYNDLTPRQKVVVILLGEIVRSGHGLSDDEYLPPVKVAKESGLELGEAYPLIRGLSQEGILENEERKYRIPPSETNSAIDFLR